MQLNERVSLILTANQLFRQNKYQRQFKGLHLSLSK